MVAMDVEPAQTQIVRTFKGLPDHSWAHIHLQYLAMETWDNKQVSFWVDGSQIENRTYNNSLRHIDICEGSGNDSLDKVDLHLSHSSSLLELEIHLPEDIIFGVYAIMVDVGTCPRNCLSCSSPMMCN